MKARNLKMDYEKAVNLMKSGSALLSEVSQTVYENDNKGRLLREGLVVSRKTLTDEEIIGDWTEVTIIDKMEDFNKLSDSQVENILKGAYQKHQFDLKDGR